MRVRIGDYWLAGDPSKREREHSQTHNRVITPVRLSQQVDGLRWTSSKAYDRGNEFIYVDFETTRCFESIEALMDFQTGYMGQHAWTGTVVFRLDLSNSDWKEYNLVNAVLSPPQFLPPMGVSLTIRYNARGSAWEAGNTGNYDGLLDQSGAGILDQTGNNILQQ
jgi:hypothetical protein